jgi:predicted Zn-dependent peptidase
MIRSFLHTLNNGLRVVCVEMPHLHAAELAVYLKVGGRNDPPGREGLSHFLEHILFRGTADFPSSLAIEAAFEIIGGAPNAATDAESTYYYSRVHPDSIKRGMEIFASMLTKPLLASIDIERRIIAEEAREDLNEQGEEVNPDTIVSRMLWPRHPLGMPTIGTLASVAAIELKDIEEHLKNYYTPSNAVVVVSGPVKNRAVLAAAKDCFGLWPDTSLPSVPLVKLRHFKPEIRCVYDSDSQMNLQLAFLGFARDDHRFMALRFLRRILAGGGSSRLHLRLREELGIVYSVDGAIGAYDETGCLAFDLSTAPDTLVHAVEATLEELLRISVTPVPGDELNRIRNSYIFDLEFSRDSAYELGGRYGWGELMGVVRSIEEDQGEARRVTAAGIRETARALFAPENLRMVAVGPWKRGMKKRLLALVDAYEKQYHENNEVTR